MILCVEIKKTKLKQVLLELIDACTMVRTDQTNAPDIEIDDAELNDWVDKFEDLIK